MNLLTEVEPDDANIYTAPDRVRGNTGMGCEPRWGVACSYNPLYVEG